MKKLLLSISLSILFFFSFNPGDEAFAYDKKSLVERFTNASCAPCASMNNAWYNATTGSMVASGTISHIIYNVWWPGSSDPMYLLNQADNTTRTNYYGCNSVPWVEVNATHISNSVGAFNTAVTNGNNEYAPFNIVITQGALSENLIQVGVKITRDPNDVTTFGNVKLRVAITEKIVRFTSPPGSNGESEFFSVCRKMMPNAGGSTFTIPAPGDFVEVNLEYIPTTQFNNAVNLDSLRIVAFIQDDNGQDVYQSASLELVPNFVAIILPTSPDVIGDNTTPAEFSTVLRNIGMMDDTYDISANFNAAPVGWTGEFTTENGTFSFGQSDAVTIATGDSAVITVTVNPNVINGSGETAVEFSSQNNPGMSSSAILRNVTNSEIDILVIDASEGGYANAITNALDGVASETYGVVSRSALHAPGVDLSRYYMITWSAGITVPAFYQEEVTALQNYLDVGGRLFINGQDIGADIFEPTGQSQFAQGFYNNYLHADYVANTSFQFLLNGFAGDPITDGIQLVLGLVYDKFPDEIAAFDADATPILQYLSGPKIGGLRVESMDYKVVYLPFGMEQLEGNFIDERDTIMARSVRWLMENTVLSTDNDDVVIKTYGLEQNYPNPFNPSTTINYALANEEHVSLKVYDIMGREVAELVNEDQTAGTYSLDFDASSLASGMYFYKISAGNFVSTKKMVLLK